MEQRIGDEQYPHFEIQTPVEFLIPSFSVLENNGRRHNSPSTNPINPFYIRAVPDQTLEAALSRLNLSSAYNQPPPPCRPSILDGDIGGVNSAIAGEALLRLPFRAKEQSDVSLRFNDQMDFGVGHSYPAVGPESWESFLSLPNPTASASYRDECLASRDESYLHCKKQLPQHLNTQFQITPCSNRNNSNSISYNPLPQQLNYLSLEDFGGMIVYLAKDQFGCRILQAKFKDPNEEEIEMVLSEVMDHIGDLMKDQFGNYLIQKLVALCNENQRSRIVLSVTKAPFQLIGICLNPHGTRAIQKLFDHLTTPQQVSLVMSVLSPGAAVLATDPNGHHVIQYCLTHFSNEDNKHIINEIAGNCFRVATDRSGCCVLQSCVEHSRGEPRKHLVTEIIANAIHLAEDPYGNYVLQHMLGLRIPEVTADLLRQLEGNYVYISCNKYASNVVEKCLLESGEEQSTRIIMELLRSPNVSTLLTDPYGNFVIQSALSVSKGLVRNAMLYLVQLNAPSIRTNLYGKKVLACFDKIKLRKA